MTAHFNFLLLALIAYAGLGRFLLVARMAARVVRVPWLVIGVPLHLF